MDNNLNAPELNVHFDPSQIQAALNAADQAAQANQLADNGLTTLSSELGRREPLAWTDELGQVWPHEVGSQMHSHINYLYTRDEVDRALAAANGIVTVQTVPSYMVPQVTGEAPPPAQMEPTSENAAKLARARAAMLQTFGNPAGAAVRAE